MISTKINAEIKEYQEKLFLGLSIRQLICVALAMILAVSTGVVGVYYFHLDMNLLSYVIMLEVLPFLGLGFIRREGYPFEKYVAVFLRWYATNPQIPVKPYEEVYHATQKNRKNRCECQTGAALTASAGKSRKKAASKRLAIAKKETRQEQRRLRQKGKAAAGAAHGQ